MTTFIDFADDPSDRIWLKHNFKIDSAGFVCCILYGNEDCPRTIHLYRRNHVACMPQVWQWGQLFDKHIMLFEGEAADAPPRRRTKR